MKVKLVTATELPGAFVVEAQSADEALILRNFVNWPTSTKEPMHLFIGNFGGNIGDNEYSFMFHWRKESECKPLDTMSDAEPT